MKKETGNAIPGKNPLLGRWRITEMQQWDADYLDIEVPAFIEIARDSSGEFQFGCVQGQIDFRLVERDGKPAIEFSWVGFDEGDEESGRGWAVLDSENQMTGHIFIHGGDDSGFKAKRTTPPPRKT